MSLINQMLQDLDARGTPAALGGVLHGQVRAVPQRGGVHPAWWLALLLACALCAGGLWVWIGRAAPAAVPQPRAALPLKIDMDLSTELRPSPLFESIPAAPASHQAAPAAAIVEPAVANAGAVAPLPTTPGIPPLAAVASVKGGQPVAVSPTAGERIVPTGPAGTAAATVATKDTAPARLAPLVVAPPAMPAVSATPAPLAKQVRELTPQQFAENDYRKASSLIQQGRTAEAIAALEQALRLDARHVAARQTLTALLIDSRRQDEAVRSLREGLQLDPAQTGLAMILARLQLERGELKPALQTLQRSLPHAADRADYLAFLAALLQRDGRHREAIEQYALALRKAPGNAVWWMGQGISLQAENRIPEAIDAYTRAKAGDGLSAELRAFVEEKLNSL
ncbi:tetratricopeptide repeat protein [Noviherbaspirillum sedimenti]|uniref:Uncharacterized protein n=1 Tax=Noviherbaspirillum sedimenti TaxID=2320865 RepID=A0A3A3GG57_9BURK|nr:tetratricopeptide repeat protein [Noviherbaspirillum sedimenti]RJG01246.1 hypothetical protein D3878_06325 [Noviherbaspirillum sedimenti]